MIRVKTTVTDKDHGYKKLAAELGGAGTLTLGVQGKEATQKHPESDLTIGQVAAIHELGIGVPERSWLRSWMDANEQRMKQETASAYAAFIAGRVSRKKALEGLGFKWVRELRENIELGRITPPLAASTIARKGHAIPLLATGSVKNAITFKLFLPQARNIKDPAERGRIGTRTVPGGPTQGVEVPVTQPPATTSPLSLKEQLVMQKKQLRALRKANKKAATANRALAKKLRGPQVVRVVKNLRSSGGRQGGLLMWLIRKLKQAALHPRKAGDGRNHGFTNSGRGGYTGRKGFVKR